MKNMELRNKDMGKEYKVVSPVLETQEHIVKAANQSADPKLN